MLKPLLKFSNLADMSSCEICHKTKQVREPFSLSSHKSTALFELVHADLW